MSKCLVIKNDGIGDMVLSIDILNHISQFHGGKIDILCCDISTNIVKKYINADKIYSVSRDPHFLYPPAAGRTIKNYIKDIIKSLLYRPTKRDREVKNTLSNVQYDVVIVLRRYIRQSAFYFMSSVKAKNKLCFWQYPTNLTLKKAALLSKDWEHVEAAHSILHEGEYYRNILNKYYGEIPYKYIYDSNICDDRCRNQKAIAAILGNVKKGISPEIWKEVIKTIIKLGYKVDIYGGKDTHGEYQKFCQENNIKLYANKLSLSDSGDKIKEYPTVIGNDTGLVHVATFNSRKVVIFCSGETPLRFFPWTNNNNQYVIYNGLECFDCGYCTKNIRYCVKTMDTEKMVSLFIDIISNERLLPGIYNLTQHREYNIAHRWIDNLHGMLK